jgi:sterol desaturase/sphingolipid hydroxylase (fatty acid hydroxylase superfamily)
MLIPPLHDLLDLDARVGVLGRLRMLALFGVVFVPFELVFPVHSQRLLRRGLTTDVLFHFLGPILLIFPMSMMLAGLAALGAWVTPAAAQHAVQSQPLWLQIIEAALIGDLGVYLGHRVQHEVPALWRFHAVHHSAESLDWIAGARFHPIDLLITRGVSFTLLFAAGFSMPAIYGYLGIYVWESYGVHANIRTDFGPLRYLLVSPISHHWHHSRDRRAWGRNYAGFIALWDVLFGTFFLPRGERPGDYGTDTPVPPDIAGQIFFPFRPLPRAPRAAEGVIAPPESSPVAGATEPAPATGPR